VYGEPPVIAFQLSVAVVAVTPEVDKVDGGVQTVTTTAEVVNDAIAENPVEQLDLTWKLYIVFGFNAVRLADSVVYVPSVIQVVDADALYCTV
jgi:hypothetical protein